VVVVGAAAAAAAAAVVVVVKGAYVSSSWETHLNGASSALMG